MCRNLWYVLLSLAAGSLLGAAPSAAADAPKLDAFTAEQLLDRMSKAYANCKTYRDSGVVKTVFFQATGKRTVNKPFTTAFVRPDRFRFEYRERKGDDEENRYLIWSNGQYVQTWWDIKPGVTKAASLNMALAAATGVSSGSAHTIPVLLMPKEIGGGRLTGMTDVKRIEDAKFDNVDCFRVEGKNANNPQTLWLDKNTFLVRRIDSQHTFPNFRTEQTTTYSPVLDSEVTEKMLVFDPPK
jgi:outer membrane lipoprotein-sorting protein